MSPEQINGEALDGRSDLYSLGVVGFLALTGRIPFDGSLPTVLVAHIGTPAPKVASIAPGVPEYLASVVDRCLAKRAENRFESGEALAEALEKASRLAEHTVYSPRRVAQVVRRVSDWLGTR